MFAFYVLFGCLICAGSAAIAFDRPSWARTYTTFARYHIARLAHTAFWVTIIVCISFALRYSPLGRWDYKDVASAALATCLTLGFITWLQGPRRWLHGRAGIPRVALSLAKALSEGGFQPESAVATQANALLVTRGIAPDSGWLPIAQPIHKLLGRATALFVVLRTWESRVGFEWFIQEGRLEFDRLRRRYDRVSFRASRSLLYFDRIATLRLAASQSASTTHPEHKADQDRANDSARRLVTDIVSDTCEDLSTFYEDACLLVARAALMKHTTRAGRNAFVRGIGFSALPVEKFNVVGLFCLVALLLYIGCLVAFSASPTAASDLKSFPVRVTTITLISFGAMFIAIFPKLRWGFANAGLHDKTPWVFVLAAGVGAVIFAIAVDLSVGAVVIGGWAGALTRLQNAAPWLVSNFVIGASIAWLIQDPRWRTTISSRVRRIKDALFLGVLWVAGPSVVGLIVHRAFVVSPDVLLTSFTLGALMGLLIPEWVRNISLRPLTRAKDMKAPLPKGALPNR